MWLRQNYDFHFLAVFAHAAWSHTSMMTTYQKPKLQFYSSTVIHISKKALGQHPGPALCSAHEDRLSRAAFLLPSFGDIRVKKQ
jgi:hypothetical protein